MIVPLRQHPASVLLGVDGSEHSLAALVLLKDLPCAGASLVRMMSVWSGRSKAEQKRMEMALQQARELMTGSCAEVSGELCQGHPAEILVQAASRLHPDLIVVGATGLRSTLGILLGGVAQQVVEHACCAVLVVRAPYLGLGQVLLVTDGSETSTRAIEYVAHLSLPVTAHVRVCHVTAPLGLPEYTAGVWPVGQDMVPMLSDGEVAELEKGHEQDRERGRALLSQSVDYLRDNEVEADGVLLEGDAATEILRYARTHEVGLIVAGSRGLSQVQGWWMGSVSRKLVNFSGCSVLIVKGPKDAG